MSGIKSKLKQAAKNNAVLWIMLEFYRKVRSLICKIKYGIPDMLRYKEKNCYCLVCGHKVGRFIPSVPNVPTDIFLKHHIIGGWLNGNICPYCQSRSRYRWQIYVLKNYSGILDKPCNVLHFAAEEYNSKLIRTNKNCRYITADIEPRLGDVTCDITDLNMFNDNTFDYIIANHVLEHVENESKAISELKRVLKHDGTIILSFPICTDMLTYEDPSITTEAGRWAAFGQGDHVRLYGKDFREHLENYGLNVKIYSPENELTPEEIKKYGFIHDDVSIFCTLKD